MNDAAETVLDPIVQDELEQLSYEVLGAQTDLEKLRAVQNCAAALEPYRTAEIERDLIEIAQQCKTNLSPEAIEGIVRAGFQRARIAREWREERGNGPIQWPASTKPPGTAASTIDALLFELRSGLSCLSDPGARERLRRCDETAIRTIARELLGWKAKNKPWLPAWSEEDVNQLIDIWKVLK